MKKAPSKKTIKATKKALQKTINAMEGKGHPVGEVVRPFAYDLAYTIAKEDIGEPGTLPFVLRHNGVFVHSSPFYSAILVRAAGHRAAKNGAAIVEEMKP